MSVTIIIPFVEDRGYLQEAIESAENQTYKCEILLSQSENNVGYNLNKAIDQCSTEFWVYLCDDDILLPNDFLDEFLFLQEKYDFAVAQPARTHNSYIDHQFVEQLDGLTARRTHFVEIGPLISIRRDVFSVLFPFDESSSMGWGYDFVWPHVIEKIGLRMGIVDATPVDHSMRMPMKNYDYDEANKSLEAFFSKNLHLSKSEAFRILESYAVEPATNIVYNSRPT